MFVVLDVPLVQRGSHTSFNGSERTEPGPPEGKQLSLHRNTVLLKNHLSVLVPCPDILLLLTKEKTFVFKLILNT